MNQREYDEMVGLIETWWGPTEVWQAPTLWPLFAELPTDLTFEVLTSLRDGSRYADFPPKPPALRSATIDRMRHDPRPLALPPPEEERYDWAEYSRRVYGEVISLDEAVRLSNEAQLVGVAAPSMAHPWRRPDSPEDGPDESDTASRPPTVEDLPSDDQRAMYRAVRDIEPPEVL